MAQELIFDFMFVGCILYVKLVADFWLTGLIRDLAPAHSSPHLQLQQQLLQIVREVTQFANTVTLNKRKTSRRLVAAGHELKTQEAFFWCQLLTNLRFEELLQGSVA